jgi:hypothetical protein
MFIYSTWNYVLGKILEYGSFPSIFSFLLISLSGSFSLLLEDIVKVFVFFENFFLEIRMLTIRVFVVCDVWLALDAFYINYVLLLAIDEDYKGILVTKQSFWFLGINYWIVIF